MSIVNTGTLVATNGDISTNDSIDRQLTSNLFMLVNGFDGLHSDDRILIPRNLERSAELS
jgi:hypothetical protein